MDDYFVIPRDAQPAIPNDIGDDSYILVLKPGHNPLKVLAKDLALTSKFTFSSEEPQSPHIYDRWINSNLEEFIYYNGKWLSLGIANAVLTDPQSLTELKKVNVRDNIGVNRVWIGLYDPTIAFSGIVRDGDSWIYTGNPSVRYDRVSGSWRLLSGVSGSVSFFEADFFNLVLMSRKTIFNVNGDRHVIYKHTNSF